MSEKNTKIALFPVQMATHTHARITLSSKHVSLACAVKLLAPAILRPGRSMAPPNCKEKDQRREMGQWQAAIRPSPGSARGQLRLGGQDGARLKIENRGQTESELLWDIHVRSVSCVRLH